MIAFELRSGRLIPAAPADSLLWGQTQLIQLAAAARAAGGGVVLVLVNTATGQVRERITVTAPEPSDA